MSSEENDDVSITFIKREPRFIEEEDEQLHMDLPSTKTSRSVQFNMDKNKYHSPCDKPLKSILRHQNDNFDQNQSMMMNRRKSFGTPSKQVGQIDCSHCKTCNRGFSHQIPSAYPQHPPPSHHYPFGYPPYGGFPYPSYFPPPPQYHPHYCPQIPNTHHPHQNQSSHLQMPVQIQQYPSQDTDNSSSSSDLEYDSDDFLGKKKKSKISFRHGKVRQSDKKSEDQDDENIENIKNIENDVTVYIPTPSGHKEKVTKRLKFPREKKSHPAEVEQRKEVVESESVTMEQTTTNSKKSKRKSVKPPKVKESESTIKKSKSLKKK